MPRTLIIGGGLAGLSAAYHLKGTEWEIVEREARAGGLCRTEKAGQFLFDYAIHILYSSDKYASTLIKDVLLKGNFREEERSSWVYSKDVYTRYPFQANTYGLPTDVVKECVMGVIKARYGDHHGPKPANFEEFIIRTFGDGIAKHFMIPFNKKCWGIEPSLMSIEWVEGRVPVPSVEEVVEGALTDQKKGFGPNAMFWYPERGGIESLPKGFLPFLDKSKISLNTNASSIDIKEKKVTLEEGGARSYERLISTMPIGRLIRTISNTKMIPPEVGKAAGALENNVIYGVNFGIKREGISEKHWVYLPEEEFRIHRVSFPMNFSPAMAPRGRSSITVEISSSRFRPIEKEKIYEIVISDLVKAGFLKNPGEITDRSILVLDPAYVTYHNTHRKDVDLMLEWLESHRIYSCGRFGSWEYLNMDHSILSGKKAAEKASRE